MPIFEQLQLEEALLRADERNFCIVNRGSPRAIVMGISGQPDQLLDLSKVRKSGIPVIKRFSGGGTVIVDEDTLFVTFIMAKEQLDVAPFPEPILRWSADFYAAAWGIPEFHLQENDYCIGDKKCGGNAQYMRKDRWIHHTSFLWDYDPNNMGVLLLPDKRPVYRKDRSHEEFLCRLRFYGGDINIRIDQIAKELGQRFAMKTFDMRTMEKKPHRQATTFINLSE